VDPSIRDTRQEEDSDFARSQLEVVEAEGRHIYRALEEEDRAYSRHSPGPWAAEQANSHDSPSAREVCGNLVGEAAGSHSEYHEEEDSERADSHLWTSHCVEADSRVGSCQSEARHERETVEALDWGILYMQGQWRPESILVQDVPCPMSLLTASKTSARFPCVFGCAATAVR